MEPRIAQDIADFRKLRENGCIYVDKTAILHELVCDPTRSLYFISRPRRFGKSLMLSTLECLFRGQRELFKGSPSISWTMTGRSIPSFISTSRDSKPRPWRHL